MFKILLLQTWYGLSGYEVKERINDSLLFSEFLLLDMGLPAPDHSTICRFRAELTRLGIMDKLLRELNKQFKKHGIIRIDQGAIVDASIVDSPHAPDGSILIEVADDREDLRTEEEQAQEQAYQYELKSRKPGVDTEARWVRKGRHYRYGYKKHVLTDGQGLVESGISLALRYEQDHNSPPWATPHDTRQLLPLHPSGQRKRLRPHRYPQLRSNGRLNGTTKVSHQESRWHALRHA